MSTPNAVLDRDALLRLRWAGVAVLGAVLGAGTLGWLPASAPLTAAGVLVSAIALNLVLARVGERATGPVLLGDTALLTWMLAGSGGVSNPFTLLYLFPVLLASLVLSPAWSAGLGAATTCCFAGLYFTSPAHHHMEMSQHLVGMVVAYGLTVPLLAGAVHRFRTAAALAETEARLAREARAVSERLTSLAALAGGAAHELATPLTTILLIARELERTATGPDREELVALGLEVESCREILDQLAVEAGTGAGESASTVDLATFTREAVAAHEARVQAEPVDVCLPVRLVGQALRRLVGNARDATGPAGEVVLRAARSGGQVVFEVEDDGPGMPPEVLARCCEPFFTTKPSGQGRGLGLFFVHSLAEQLDGTLELTSTVGSGTLARLTLPGGAPCASS